jgi:hypothetical protein
MIVAVVMVAAAQGIHFKKKALPKQGFGVF